MAEVTLRSIRASVLCVGDAGIIFQPGERRVMQELTPGLQRAVDMGWLLRENGKAKASGNGQDPTPTPDTGEEEARSEDHTLAPSGADASLFPSTPEENSVSDEKPPPSPKGKGGRNKKDQAGGVNAAE